MPYAAKPMVDDPNDPNKTPGQGVNISGGSGANFATGVPGQEGSSSRDKKSSGNYANIQSYLDANKDQADGMGQKIASDVGAKAEDATQKIGGLSGKAPTVAAYDPNEAYKNATSLSDDQKNEYKTIKQTGGYTGPQTVDQVEGYGDAQKAASEASTSVKNAGNEYGQQQLLRDTYKRPQYSAGENRLDQVLLQNSEGSRQALEGVTSKYSGLDDLFSNTSKDIGGKINTANTQALANKQAIATGEQNAVKGLVDPIQARAAQMNIDNPALIKRIQDDAADHNLSDESLRALGLSEGQNVYDLNLGNYINTDGTQVGVDNVANADERAKYAALAGLFGDQSMSQITSGGKTVNPVSFNKDQFDKDAVSKKAELENIVDNQEMYGNSTIKAALDYYTWRRDVNGGAYGPEVWQAEIDKVNQVKQAAMQKHGLNNVIQKG